MIFEIIEPYIEVINLILSVIIMIFGIQITFRLRGELKNAWAYFLTAILLFGVHEIFGSLAEFGIWELDGLYAFTEFLFIAVFGISIFVFRRLFINLSKTKRVKNE